MSYPNFYLNNLQAKNTVSKIALVVVNFGGPRNLLEVSDFLEALLTDPDVIRTRLPGFIQRLLFRKIAQKRAPKIAEDYEKIGGGSPIFADTEWMAKTLSEILQIQTLTFHRYLESTHKEFLDSLDKIEADELLIFPLFPQFSYVTTGSIARWFSTEVKKDILHKMRWVSSYSSHEAYIAAFCSLIRGLLKEKSLQEVTLLFSAHGLPVKYVKEGDPYQQECEASFKARSEQFPEHTAVLAYQSQFGKGQWLTPSTLNICTDPHLFLDPNKPVVFIPLSFSSDHIETLFEIEEQYVKPLKDLGFSAYRCPALGRRLDWVEAAKEIIKEAKIVQNHNLIRPSKRFFG
ncbi:MAG: ferrochelatase [Verrucomicrobia bacterium]|nr:ferrochelatase [Verrucomicrobiota bacterium]